MNKIRIIFYTYAPSVVDARLYAIGFHEVISEKSSDIAGIYVGWTDLTPTQIEADISSLTNPPYTAMRPQQTNYTFELMPM